MARNLTLYKQHTIIIEKVHNSSDKYKAIISDSNDRLKNTQRFTGNTDGYIDEGKEGWTINNSDEPNP